MKFETIIAHKLNIKVSQVNTVVGYLNEGATIPFIARYRKDQTGGLDEVQIQLIQEEKKRLVELHDRKTFIEKSITEQGKMTEFIQNKLNEATDLSTLEDIYLPYKPKRKTKAQAARENGLEPLANFLLSSTEDDVELKASEFINEAITTVGEALQGARDIIAEWICEDAEIRTKLRKLFQEEGMVESKVVTDKEKDGIKYKDYFIFSEPIHKIPSHRILAILRGFLEGYLRLSILPDEDNAIGIIEKKYVQGLSVTNEQIKKAVKDAYKRLLQPSLESECRTALKQKADEEAINVFSENLRQLLLSSPLGAKRILSIDPGYRTGCKVVCLDENGELIKTALIYIHEGNKQLEAEHIISGLVSEYKIEAFAIGDGTAGRETEAFIKKLNCGIPIYLVNEDGASIYSASEIAREEFPNEDITIRGSVSIGRRLIDPLAELVKIDPKSIGVGQYQHDVNQFRLKEKLDQTVVSCVNLVGVNLNTASKSLLSYVSGIGTSLADNILQYRRQNGKFRSRKELLNVARLGAISFEQCAGFLKIKDGQNPLDASSVHPEAYGLVENMASDLQVDLLSLIGNEAIINSINVGNYVSDRFGELTIKDILAELKKPGLDPRSEVQSFEFAPIYSIEDLQVGIIVPGLVTNITRFGAFVDIGVKQDGLVHVSEIAHRFISDPAEALKLNQQVKVKILEVDIARKRINLSIKQAQDFTNRIPKKEVKFDGNKIGVKANQTTVSIEDALSVLKSKFKN